MISSNNKLGLLLSVLLTMAFFSVSAWAYTYNDYLNSVIEGADRLVETQNNDGTWEWESPDLDKTNGGGACIENIVGITAFGLLEAYELTGDTNYLNAAKYSADRKVVCGYDKANDKYYSQDIEFLARLGAVTGDSVYSNKANDIMNYFLTQDNRYCAVDGCTAAELAAFYQGIYPADGGITEWQLASWVRAAELTGKTIWANDMKTEMNADITSPAYFDILDDTQLSYVIGLTGIISETGNMNAKNALVDFQNLDGSWIDPNGGEQDTAYAIMSLTYIGEFESSTKGAEWLYSKQLASGGWLGGNENTEVTSEAIMALEYFAQPPKEAPSVTLPALFVMSLLIGAVSLRRLS